MNDPTLVDPELRPLLDLWPTMDLHPAMLATIRSAENRLPTPPIAPRMARHRVTGPPHNNRFGWASLPGHEPGGSDGSPYAAAARASDLSRLPPTFISTGALDLLVEEDIDDARRPMRAGVPTELHVYTGAFHGFDIHPTPAVAGRARRRRTDAFPRALSA